MVQNDKSALAQEYYEAVDKLSSKWKDKYFESIVLHPDKRKYFEQKVTFFQKMIFDQIVPEQPDFIFLNHDTNVRYKFYSHLRLLVDNLPVVYTFMDRTIDGRRLSAFEGDLIPEVSAGAVWDHYRWLTQAENKNDSSADLYALLCYYEGQKVTRKNAESILQKYNLFMYRGEYFYKRCKYWTSNSNRTSNDIKSTNDKRISLYKKLESMVITEDGKKLIQQDLNLLSRNIATEKCG